MKRNTLLAIFMMALPMLFFTSCAPDSGNNDNASARGTGAATTGVDENYDPHRGEGKWDETNVKLDPTLNVAMAEKGKSIYDTKCTSCHKLSDERLVGPGWKGVTVRHKPYWIMNFITNPDGMLDKDPELQEQLDICLVRMPDQNLSDDDARNILEFMRENDGVK